MILTKDKENILNLNSGINNYELVLLENTSCGNFWVDWAEAFITFCEMTLGLEVEKGPGTSVGAVWSQSGGKSGIPRYSYDCDWTQIDGRVPGHENQERGFTLWENIIPWNQEKTDADGYNDDISNSLIELGIDKKNRRFDFILWFTTENENGERLGLRFKYPLTHERGGNSNYYISPTPVCMAWRKVNTEGVNNYAIQRTWNETKNSTNRNYYINTNQINLNERLKLLYNKKLNTDELTKVFNENHNWILYSEFPKEGELYYKDLNNSSNSFDTPDNYRTQNNALKKIRLTISKNTEAINLRIENAADRIAIDILYGNLVQESNQNSIKSYIMVKTTYDSNSSYMADFLLTEDNYIIKPKIQVNRPTSLNNSQQEYCAVGRLLLDKEKLYCKDLYQVFSFNKLMDERHDYEQVFIDKNENQHPFILFNYGWGETADIRKKQAALAIPK